MMFTYNPYYREPVLSDGAKRALGWLGASLLVGIIWTFPAWGVLFGLI